jgi:threonine dehydrogenase-like Zn-dependent dehydrogenase
VKALCKDGTEVAIKSRLAPKLVDSRHVRIAVVMAGLCRTDLYAAQGQLAGPSSLVLGHEFSGRILDVGGEVEGLRPGSKVAVFPWLGCGVCPVCLSGLPTACSARQMLGVDRDGAFAEEIVVPASLVYALPEEMSFQAGAYVEPVAASLSVLKAGLSPSQRGLVFGQSRIAELTYRIMVSAGFLNLHRHGGPGALRDPRADIDTRDWPESSFDFVVETLATPQAMRECLRLLRPGGQLILKSRYPWPLELDMLTLVAKELKLSAVNYGDFQESIELLRTNAFPLQDLLGPVHPLEDWRLLFDEASQDESTKRFFQLNDDPCAA